MRKGKIEVDVSSQSEATKWLGVENTLLTWILGSLQPLVSSTATFCHRIHCVIQSRLRIRRFRSQAVDKPIRLVREMLSVLLKVTVEVSCPMHLFLGDGPRLVWVWVAVPEELALNTVLLEYVPGTAHA